MLVIVPMFHANAWGMPVRRLHDRGRPDHAPSVPPGRAARRASSPSTARPCRRGAHHLERPAALLAESTRRHVVAAHDHRRAAPPCPARSSRQFRDELRDPHDPGLGDDRDQPAVLVGPAAQAALPRTRRSTGGPRPAGSSPGWRSGWWPRTARCMPNDGESVGEFEVRGPWITGSYYGEPDARSGSTTDGCGPGTSGPRPPGLHADQRPDQGRHQVGWGVDLVGRARERGHGPPRRVRGGRHRRARRTVERASPGGRGAGRGRRPLGRRDARLPRGTGQQVVAARAMDLHRGDAQDQRGQVRQEGPAGPGTPTEASTWSRSTSRPPADRGGRRSGRDRRTALGHRRGARRPGPRPAAGGHRGGPLGRRPRSGAHRRRRSGSPGPGARWTRRSLCWSGRIRPEGRSTRGRRVRRGGRPSGPGRHGDPVEGVDQLARAARSGPCRSGRPGGARSTWSPSDRSGPSGLVTAGWPRSATMSANSPVEFGQAGPVRSPVHPHHQQVADPPARVVVAVEARGARRWPRRRRR